MGCRSSIVHLDDWDDDLTALGALSACYQHVHLLCPCDFFMAVCLHSSSFFMFSDQKWPC